MTWSFSRSTGRQCTGCCWGSRGRYHPPVRIYKQMLMRQLLSIQHLPPLLPILLVHIIFWHEVRGEHHDQTSPQLEDCPKDLLLFLYLLRNPPSSPQSTHKSVYWLWFRRWSLNQSQNEMYKLPCASFHQWVSSWVCWFRSSYRQGSTNAVCSFSMVMLVV